MGEVLLEEFEIKFVNSSILVTLLFVFYFSLLQFFLLNHVNKIVPTVAPLEVDKNIADTSLQY